VDHRDACDHQAFVWQHHQHVTALQGCAPCACPNPLHCMLYGGHHPSTMSNAASSSKEQVVAHRHALKLHASVTDHGVVCGGRGGREGSAALHSHRPPTTRAPGSTCDTPRRGGRGGICQGALKELRRPSQAHRTLWMKEPPASLHCICETLQRPLWRLPHLPYVLPAEGRSWRQDGTP
jgi:hypothetical protein